MKFTTCNSLNPKKWFSNSTIEFILFSSSRLSSFITTKKWIYYFIFHQYTYLKKLRLKNNLSKFNQRMRDVITTKTNMTIKSYLRNGYEKTYIT